MAYNKANLTALAYGNGFTLWHYTSADTIATVNTAGYFNDAADMLGVRDLIIVNDSTTPAMALCQVLSNASGVVDIADGLVVPETDTD